MTTTLDTKQTAVRVTAAPITVVSKKSMRRAHSLKTLGLLLPVLGTIAGVLIVWYAVSYLLLTPERREILVPPPQEVFGTSLFQWSHVQPMLQALWLDVQVSMSGLFIASILGIALATLMSLAAWVERLLYPYAIVLQTVPILAITALIGLWFQYGFNARVIVVVMISIFPMISNPLFGLHSADRGAHDLFTLNRASRWQRLSKLQIPAAMPSIFAGLRISSGLSVIGAIVGDFFFTQGQPGLGTLLNNYQSRAQSSDLFAAIILSSLFSIAVFGIFTVIAKKAVGSWYTGTTGKSEH